MSPERVAELARGAKARPYQLLRDPPIPMWEFSEEALQRFAALIEQEIRADDARICRELGDFGTYPNVCAAAIERAAVKGTG